MMESGKVSILYVPCGSDEEAVRIATALINEKLVACGNIVASRSLYYWEGKIADEVEQILLCKTTEDKVEAARERISQLHSYEIPCIIEVEAASANSAYARWVQTRVGFPSAELIGASGAQNEVKG